MSFRPTLPQRESDKIWRESELDRLRHDYAYTLTYGGKIATINELPSYESPGFYYYFVATMNVMRLIPSVPGLIYKAIKHGLFNAPFQDVYDYKLFGLNRIPADELRDDFWSDERFARQFLAGPNPVIIECVTEQCPIPSTFKVEESEIPISQDTLEQAKASKRLYIVNFEMLDRLKKDVGKVGNCQKHVVSPICLFIQKDSGHLQPVAIQLDVCKDTSKENPIYTPGQKRHWKLAKICLQNANSVLHELWIHAVQIHYVMESIIMSSYRQLSMKHPLLVLLDPHLQYTLSVNANALYEPGKNGKVPTYGKMFPPENKALVNFMGEGMDNFKFHYRGLPHDIKNRRMDNADLIYPYRDDGLPIWNAIQKFSSNYIGLYYENDNDVVEDYEIQAWANEIGGERSEGKCGIPGFPAKFENRSELAEVVGQIIFTATAHHSAIHLPQYPYAHFVPNMPNSLYHPVTPLEGKELSDEGIMRFLPPFGMALLQTFIYFAVNFKVNKLGEYNLKLFDRRAKKVIKDYQSELRGIHKSHTKKYQNSPLKYPYMDPAQIPNSVTS